MQDVLYEIVDFLFFDRPDPDSHLRSAIQLVLRAYVGAFYSTTKGNSTPLFSIGPTLSRTKLYNVQNYTISLLDLPFPFPALLCASLTLLEFVDCKRYSCNKTWNFSVL